MTPGVIASLVASLVGAAVTLATFVRVVISENTRATRQLEILQTIDALRKEIADKYVDCNVFDARNAAVDLRFHFVEQRVARLEDGKRAA